MPDKEGSEDEKTTKGVVKKKQKQILNQEQTNPVKTFAKTASSVLNTKKGQEKNYNKKSLDTYRKEGGEGTARYEEEYLPEEEYDHYRDRIAMAGGDHRSKETRERSNTPTGKQPKGKTVYQKQAEKKYGKGKSALDMVKADITAKYGKGAIMDVKKKSKKKANEELDLTKIAEAFGGYIIEAKSGSKKKSTVQNQQEPPIRSGSTDSDPSFEAGFRRTKAFQQLNPDAKAGKTRTSTPSLRSGFDTVELENPKDKTKQSKLDQEAKKRVKTGKKQSTTAFTNEPLDDVNIPKEVRDPKTGETLTKDYADTEAETEKKRKEVKQSAYSNPETARKGETVVDQDKFSTRTGIVGRGGVEVTSSKGDGRKAGRTKEERRTGKVTYKTFVNKPEVTGGQDRATDTMSRVDFQQPPQPQPDKVTQSQTAFVEPPLQPEKKPRTIPFKEPKEYSPETQRQINQIKRNIEKREKENPDRRTKKYKEAQTQTQADGGGKGGGNKIVKTSRGGGKPFKNFATSLVNLSKNNPALSLIGYDQLKNMQNPFAIRGGRSGMASARGGGGL